MADKRIEKERKKEPSEPEPEPIRTSNGLLSYNAKKLNKWLETVRHAQQQYYIQPKARLSANQTKFISVKTVKCDIASWMYEPDMKVCIVKWENDIQCFDRFPDILSMPRWDVCTLASRPFMNRGRNELLCWLYIHLVHDVHRGFKFFQPPKRQRINLIDPRIGRRKLVLKVKLPCTMKKIMLKVMPQDFHKEFNWWYYDNKTGEAIIVLGSVIK